MTQNTAMRSGRDRLRYTFSFEVTLMAVLIPVGAIVLDRDMADIGVLGAILSIKAMMVNLAYNWIFDKIDARAGRVSSNRSVLGRILHAIGFEMFLLITSLPIYMWWLQFTIFQAVAADLVVTSFVVVYTYFFTLAYDRLFPVFEEPVSAD